jgi:hypothetical protein
MLESKAKIKARDFVKHVKVLAQGSSERIVDGFQETEKDLMKRFISDTEELIEYNEWGIGLENLLSNLYEIEFPLDREAVDLAKVAIKECKMNYDHWMFIEELVK